MELFEKGPIVVFVWKNKSTWPVELVTANLQNIYGYNPTEYCSGQLNYMNQIHPDDLSRVSLEVTNASNSPESNYFTHQPYRYLDGFGKYRWVKDSTQIIRADSGEITHYIGYLIDISDEVTSQEEERSLKERSDFSWIGTVDGLWDWNIITNEVYFSPRWKNMLGFEIDEIENKLSEWSTRVHPDDLESVDEDINKCLSKEVPLYENEHRILCKDGTYKWVLDRGVVSEWTDQKEPKRMVGSHLDINESKKQNKFIELINRRYISMFNEHGSIMLLINSEDGKIIDANESAQKFYGYSHEEFLSLFISDINQLSSNEITKYTQESINREKNHFIFEHRLKNGDIRTVEVFASPIDAENGKLIFSIITDITQAKENEEKLKELYLQTEADKQRYKVIMENASDAVFIMNTEGRLIECSQQAAQALGYSEEEMKNLYVYDWDVSHTKEEAINHVQNTPIEPISFETKHRRKDGSIFDVAITAVKIYIADSYYIYASVRDITESEKLKLEIIKERNFISTIVNNANAIVAVINADGTMIRLNKYAKEFIGYTEDEIKTEPYFWKRFLPKEQQSSVINILEDANKGKIKKSFRNSWISKSGEERIFEWSNALVQNSDGSMNYLVTIGIDFTEQSKQLEIIEEKNSIIEKAQLKFHTLFEESLDGIVLMDPITQKFIEFNHIAYEMYGYTKEEFGLLTPKDLNLLHNEEQIIATQQAIIKNGFDVFTTKHKMKDGTVKDIIVSVRVFAMDNNNVLHATFHDITSMKMQAELIEQQKKEFETIFNFSKDGIAIVDLTSKFLNFNDSYQEMTGYSREELLQKSCIELTASEDKERSEKALEFVLEHQHLENFEKNCIVNNGKIIVTNMSISLLPDKKRILLVTKDVSKLKLFESQAKLASMGEMIGNIAHQWRQPLSLISTIASGMAMEKEYGILKEEELIPNMEQIVEQTNYLSKTIDDFRNFIKSEKIEEQLNLSVLFDNTLSIVGPNLKNNYIEFISNIDPTLEIKGYKNELIQAFINIINNSKDALISNNFIEEKYIFIEAEQIHDQCEIIIKDNGGGIILSVMNRIFEPYFTTKHQFQGTGLGLSIVHKIITELHEGTIAASNTTYLYNGKEYTGACFKIRF